VTFERQIVSVASFYWTSTKNFNCNKVQDIGTSFTPDKVLNILIYGSPF